MNLLFEDNQYWTMINDGNHIAFDLFKRHYTYKKRRQRKNENRFSGPGKRVILLGKDHKALFVWRKENFRQDKQTGICCSVFRNEGKELSSQLILAAEEIAKKYFTETRFFTFVNPSKVKSANPGFCFKKAGWKVCGISQHRKHLILEKLAA